MRAQVVASGNARWTSCTSIPSDSASAASLRSRTSGANRRAIATVQITGGRGHLKPIRWNAWRSARRSNWALWATSTRPSSIPATCGSTASGSGADDAMACVIPVKRWIPRCSGMCGRTSDDQLSCSSPPPTSTAPTSVSSQSPPARPFVSTSTARYSASVVGVTSRSREERCTPAPRQNDCSLSASLRDRPDQYLVDVDSRRLLERVHDGIGDVFRLQRLLGLVLKERRVDHPRLDQRDAHREVVMHLAQFGAQRLADCCRCVLGGRVERARQRAPPSDRAGNHEVTAVPLEEVGEDGSDRQRRAEDVREHHRAPEVGLLLEEAPLGAE